MTPREREVYALLATGASDKQISKKLGIAVGTAKIHTSHVLRALGVNNRTQAAVAYTQGVGV